MEDISLNLVKLDKQALKKGAWSAAVNAEVARGKAAGLYIEQKIIRTGKLEDLTAEELENRMKTIIDEYSPILEGESVDELKTKVLEKGKKETITESKNFHYSKKLKVLQQKQKTSLHMLMLKNNSIIFLSFPF